MLNVNNVPGNLNANIGARLLGYRKKICARYSLPLGRNTRLQSPTSTGKPGTSDFLLSTK